jgi:hypothetical protein
MEIYGNKIKKSAESKALKQKKTFAKKYGYDPEAVYHLAAEDNNILGGILGIKNLVISREEAQLKDKKGIIVGTIRMGYGHYRAAMAVASAANSMGFTPYWLDLMSFKNAPSGKIIEHLNSLYSLGSRLSQKFSLFNKFYWEPLNSEGFKKLTYNASDQHMTELMAQVYKSLPDNMPVISTHPWPAQAAVHAGMKNVVNAILDNWPMGLHLAEGAIQTIQGPSSYFGYRILRNFDPDKPVLNPVPSGEIRCVGHLVDHELVSNIEKDCAARINRMKKKEPRRIILPIGGAGAQANIMKRMLMHLVPMIKNNEVVLLINSGDHKDIYDMINKLLSDKGITTKTFSGWMDVTSLVNKLTDSNLAGAYNFYNKDTFAAVYTTNLLMRHSDFIITKPSELAYYPIPKLMIKRVGGHEAWGAIRSAEIGDGTIECETVPVILQAIDLLVKEDDLLAMYCENIVKQKKAGTYDGAYNVVKLAMNKKAGRS